MTGVYVTFWQVIFKISARRKPELWQRGIHAFTPEFEIKPLYLRPT